MATIHDFLKCEECGKEFHSALDAGRKTKLDREGFTHIFCLECFDKQNGGK